MKILDRLFGKAEEINGRERCPTYLYRWTVAKWRGRGIYLHHFVGDDWSRDLHDHPKRFISIGLKGGYVSGCRAPNRTPLLFEINGFTTLHGFELSPPSTYTG